MQKVILFLIGIFSFSILTPLYAHDTHMEGLNYMLINPESTWTEFLDHMEAFPEELAHMHTEERKMATALSLPGKKYLYWYAKENTGFTIDDIAGQIVDDPFLGEIGVDRLYAFLEMDIRGVEVAIEEAESHDHEHTGVWEWIVHTFEHIWSWIF